MENQRKGLQRVKIHKTQDGLVQMITCYEYGSLTSDLGCGSAATYDEIYARLDNIAREHPNVPVYIAQFMCTLELGKYLARRSATAFRRGDVALANHHMDSYLVADAPPPALTLNEFGKGYARGYTEGEAAGYEKGKAESADIIAELSENLTKLGYEINKLDARNRNTKREFGERVDKAIRLLADIKAGTLNLND